jgi:hypothetical protein
MTHSKNEVIPERQYKSNIMNRKKQHSYYNWNYILNKIKNILEQRESYKLLK